MKNEVMRRGRGDKKEVQIFSRNFSNIFQGKMQRLQLLMKIQNDIKLIIICSQKGGFSPATSLASSASSKTPALP